jgi:hypothetical protein
MRSVCSASVIFALGNNRFQRLASSASQERQQAAKSRAVASYRTPEGIAEKASTRTDDTQG